MEKVEGSPTNKGNRHVYAARLRLAERGELPADMDGDFFARVKEARPISDGRCFCKHFDNFLFLWGVEAGPANKTEG